MKDRVVIADGTMGLPPYPPEEIFRGERFAGWPSDLRGNMDLLNLSAPDRVAFLHKEYIDAGAEIIRTNTRRSDRISQAQYGLADYAAEMAREGLRLARQTADAENRRLEQERRQVALQGVTMPPRHIRVAGAVGPTTCSPDLAPRYPGSPAYRDVVKAFQEVLHALDGADLIWFGPCADPVGLRAFLEAWGHQSRGKKKRLPLVVSVDTRDRYGNPLPRRSLGDYAALLQDVPLAAFGFEGPGKIDELRNLLKDAARLFPCPRLVCLDATLSPGNAAYDDRAEQCAHTLLKTATGGLFHLSGGGAGTTPAHICAMATALADIVPDKVRPAGSPERPSAILLTPRGERQTREAALTATALALAGYRVDGPAPLSSCRDVARRNAALFCLCGSTPEALWQAESLCSALSEAGSQVPLMVTGAGSSPVHTALRLAPLYGVVIHAASPDEIEDKAARLRQDPERFRKAEAQDLHLVEVRDQLRHAGYGQPPSKGKSVFRSRHFVNCAEAGLPAGGSFQVGEKPIAEGIDWRAFLRSRGVQIPRKCKGLPEISRRKGVGAQLEKMQQAIQEAFRTRKIRARAQLRFAEAYSEDDTIHVAVPGQGDLALPMMRQEKPTTLNGFSARLSLADFVPHITQAFRGPLGFYSLRLVIDGPPLPDDVRALLLQGARSALEKLIIQQSKVPDGFCVTLAEAGTPLCPDRSLRSEFADVLSPGILPEDGSSYGLVLVHRYPALTAIPRLSSGRFKLYAARRGMSEEVLRPLLACDCGPAAPTHDI